MPVHVAQGVGSRALPQRSAVLPLGLGHFHGQLAGHILRPRLVKLCRTGAQNGAFFRVNEHPPAVQQGNLLPFFVPHPGDALVHSALGALRLGDHGEQLIHPHRAGKMQRHLGQHKGGVGLGVDGVGEAGVLGVFGGDLLGAAQQRTGLHISQMVSVMAENLKDLLVFRRCHGVFSFSIVQ